VSLLLDTNVVIAVLRGSRSVIGNLNRRFRDEVFVSSLVLHELYFGAFKSDRSIAAMRDVDTLGFEVLDFSRDDARMAGNVRFLLDRQGHPISPMDTLIAGQALARDLTLVTRNIREFQRVDGLRVENWEA